MKELDFLIEENLHVVPIEVKSGKDYTKHSALNKIVENDEYEVEKAYIFANCDISISGKYLYMPVYMVMFVREETELPVLKPVDTIISV